MIFFFSRFGNIGRKLQLLDSRGPIDKISPKPVRNNYILTFSVSALFPACKLPGKPGKVSRKKIEKAPQNQRI